MGASCSHQNTDIALSTLRERSTLRGLLIVILLLSELTPYSPDRRLSPLAGRFLVDLPETCLTAGNRERGIYHLLTSNRSRRDVFGLGRTVRPLRGLELFRCQARFFLFVEIVDRLLRSMPLVPVVLLRNPPRHRTVDVPS